MTRLNLPYTAFVGACGIFSSLSGEYRRALSLVLVWDLYHAQSRPGKARNFAQCIYHKIDDNILGCANNLMSMKGDMTVSWSLAHPSIPEDKLLEFLTRLGSSSCRSGSI